MRCPMRSPFSIPISPAAPILRNRSAAPPSHSSSRRLCSSGATPPAPAKRFCPAFSRWRPSPPSPTPFPCAERIAPSPRSACANCAAPSALGLRALFAAAAARSRHRSSSPASTSPSASRRASTPPAAWTLPPTSSSSSPRATSSARSELAAKLERLNRERRDTEAQRARGHREARLADDEALAAERLLVVDGDGWHRGVIGILASRVVERTAKPASSSALKTASPTAPAARSTASLCSKPSRPAPISSRASAATPSPSALPCPLKSCPSSSSACACYAAERLAGREPERLLRIHAELPLDQHHHRSRRMAAQARAARPRQSRAHLCRAQGAPALRAAHHERTPHPPRAHPVLFLWNRTARIRAVGWDMAFRAQQLGLAQGSCVDVAYRIRENDHPDFGGLEIEIAGLEPAAPDVICRLLTRQSPRLPWALSFLRSTLSSGCLPCSPHAASLPADAAAPVAAAAAPRDAACYSGAPALVVPRLMRRLQRFSLRCGCCGRYSSRLVCCCCGCCGGIHRLRLVSCCDAAVAAGGIHSTAGCSAAVHPAPDDSPGDGRMRGSADDRYCS